ncbi:MAG: hypothetical protein JKY53_00190 [Flavobacteriales bacterium]|nr:hypothetical protein [Flavobacteriales bacterium]
MSNQLALNFYVETDPGGKEPVSQKPFPGLKPFSTGDGFDRGLGELNNTLYKVSNTKLFKVSDIGVQTLIGTIEGELRCVLDEDEAGNLVITNNQTTPYAYDGTTLTKGTDADLPSAATVTYINRRVVYDGIGGDVAFSDLDDPLSVNSANVIIAEAKPDNTLAVFAYKQQVYVFGEKSIQPLYNSGTGNPPYDFVLNATQENGLIAIHSISKNENFAYYLGSNKKVYQLTGLASRPISDPSIGQAISKYSRVDDAFGVCFTLDDQNFYLLSFPSGNETWLFNERSVTWTNLAFGTNGDQHLISDYRFIYGKHLVSDRRNGNIYELDFETYTDNGDIIQHVRKTVSVDAGVFGKPGFMVFMERLEIEIQPGTSLVTAESFMIMEFSDDNGESWSSEMWAPVGLQGEFLHKIQWFGLGSFYDRMFRFTMSDSINWTLISAHADVELEIG